MPETPQPHWHIVMVGHTVDGDERERVQRRWYPTLAGAYAARRGPGDYVTRCDGACPALPAPLAPPPRRGRR